LLALAAAMAAGFVAMPASTNLTPELVASILAEMHPDYTRYIGEIRYGSSRNRPETLYAGLVRRGGTDPRDPEDGPSTGRGVMNDLIIYTDTFETWRTPAWRLLLADHEYFHAKHLARGFRIPVVGFGDPSTDADYYEALAWGYVLDRAREGVYGDLSSRERAEVRARYEEHLERFRGFVMRRQPSAWAHYGRFFSEPVEMITSGAPVPREETAPRAAPGTR
jgi:hypothetical protein